MEPLVAYACYNLNKSIRLESSSGAVFTALAEYVIKKKGIVYGVAMSDDCYSAEFISVTDETNLKKLRGSKYLQAKVGDTFRRIKADLLSEKIVLFSGTGCQVNGLKSFLGKEYYNLICVDVICHGVPSPTLWKKYVQYQEKRNGGKLEHINFRCKDEGWTNFGMKEILNSFSGEFEKKLYISKDKDSYMQMFLRDVCLRPSCYECVAKKQKLSDLTIADFWGINDVVPDMNDGLGTSLVLIRTNKGEKIFNCIRENMQLKKVSYKSGVKENPAEFRSCIRPNQRNTFFNDMYSMDFEELEKKYASPIKISFKSKLIRKLKNLVKKILKIIRGSRE